MTRKTTHLFFLLGAFLLLSACATRTMPFSYSSVTDEYTTPEFYTTSFQDKHLLVLNYDTDNAEDAQAVSTEVGAALAQQLRERFRFAGVELLTASSTEISSANREEFLAQVLVQHNDADFILDYRMVHWADDPVEVSVNGNNLCQQVALEAKLNAVLWRSSDKKMLWRAEPEAKTGSLKCVVRTSDGQERVETDAERKERLDVSGDEAMQLVAAEVAATVIASSMERGTYNKMKLPPMPGTDKIVQQLTQLIAGQMPEY